MARTKVNQAGNMAVDKVLSELHPRSDECEECDKLREDLRNHQLHRLFMAMEQHGGGRRDVHD